MAEQIALATPHPAVPAGFKKISGSARRRKKTEKHNRLYRQFLSEKRHIESLESFQRPAKLQLVKAESRAEQQQASEDGKLIHFPLTSLNFLLVGKSMLENGRRKLASASSAPSLRSQAGSVASGLTLAILGVTLIGVAILVSACGGGGGGGGAATGGGGTGGGEPITPPQPAGPKPTIVSCSITNKPLSTSTDAQFASECGSASNTQSFAATVNGEAQAVTGSSLSSAKFQKGGIVRVSCTCSDGQQASDPLVDETQVLDSPSTFGHNIPTGVRTGSTYIMAVSIVDQDADPLNTGIDNPGDVYLVLDSGSLQQRIKLADPGGASNWAGSGTWSATLVAPDDETTFSYWFETSSGLRSNKGNTTAASGLAPGEDNFSLTILLTLSAATDYVYEETGRRLAELGVLPESITQRPNEPFEFTAFSGTTLSLTSAAGLVYASDNSAREAYILVYDNETDQVPGASLSSVSGTPTVKQLMDFITENGLDYLIFFVPSGTKASMQSAVAQILQ